MQKSDTGHGIWLHRRSDNDTDSGLYMHLNGAIMTKHTCRASARMMRMRSLGAHDDVVHAMLDVLVRFGCIADRNATIRSMAH